MPDIREILLDPALYAQHVLRHDVWWTPAAVLRSVARHPRTIVKACHASSKTFTAAEAVLWWITRFKDGIAITTAPTWTQVERLMWGEIKKAVQGSRQQWPEVKRTEIRLGDNNYAFGLLTNEGVRFQGWHGKILIVIDEALGLRADIMEAIEGIRAGGDVRVLALLNPTMSGGPFYDAFTDHRTGWSTFTIDGLDSPNTVDAGPTPEERLRRIVAAGDAGDEAFLNDNIRPYLITRKYIYEKYREWGESSPMWEARVRGQFPTFGESTLYALSWLERSRILEVREFYQGLVQVGIDVAGPGEDETVVTIKQSATVLKQQAFAQKDPRGEVLHYLSEYGARIEHINVDAIGIGYYFGHHLKDQGYKVNFINVQEPASDPQRFADTKAEIAWNLREMLEKGHVAGIVDETTISQLSTIQWRTDNRGRIEIESKEELRERGLRSPDRAESLMLAFARPNAKRWKFVMPGTFSRMSYRP
jgi:hypothetical protein